MSWFFNYTGKQQGWHQYVHVRPTSMAADSSLSLWHDSQFPYYLRQAIQIARMLIKATRGSVTSFSLTFTLEKSAQAQAFLLSCWCCVSLLRDKVPGTCTWICVLLTSLKLVSPWAWCMLIFLLALEHCIRYTAVQTTVLMCVLHTWAVKGICQYLSGLFKSGFLAEVKRRFSLHYMLQRQCKAAWYYLHPLFSV